MTQEIIFIFTSAFAALFPVINPIGNGFIIDGFIKNLDDEQRKAASKKVFINCLLIGLGSLVVGHLILLLFGLAIPVIQVGGGIIICKTGLEMLSGSSTSADDGKQEAIDKIKLEEIEQKLFYPLSFPIVVGAGTISVIFTLMASATVKDNFLHTGINYLAIALALFLMLAILYVFLLQGHRFMKKLGSSGNLIINKLVAFITFCIGIQILVTGISKIFHITVL
ncbi:MAG: MarC family protein [Prevotellaceae bacterium]|jgi:MarC family membrane protein|nr:MarC family protein [Prevotellaceae bacterium]